MSIDFPERARALGLLAISSSAALAATTVQYQKTAGVSVEEPQATGRDRREFLASKAITHQGRVLQAEDSRAQSNLARGCPYE